MAYGSGHLWVAGTAGYADTGLQVAPGSSPSIAGLAGGGYEVAFQAFVAPRPAPAPAPAAGTTSIPVPSPSPAARRRHHLRVRIVFRWRRSGSHTKLLSLRFVHLARHARIRIACHGRHCPRRLASASRAGGRAVGRALRGRVFASGQVLLLRIYMPGFVPEVVGIRFRSERGPGGRVLSR